MFSFLRQVTQACSGSSKTSGFLCSFDVGGNRCGEDLPLCSAG